jgi:hypothetical protein
MRQVSRLSFAAMPVESARSQNITMTCRRSPTASDARYRHAQLSAVKLAGDINARMADNASLDELLAKIKGGVGEAQADPRADYRLGGCARATGVEYRGRLDREELSHRARLAFRGLSRFDLPV